MIYPCQEEVAAEVAVEEVEVVDLVEEEVEDLVEEEVEDLVEVEVEDLVEVEVVVLETVGEEEVAVDLEIAVEEEVPEDVEHLNSKELEQCCEILLWDPNLTDVSIIIFITHHSYFWLPFVASSQSYLRKRIYKKCPE